ACPRETTDGPCGGKRSLVGVRAAKGTTTARDVDFARDLAAEMQAAMQRGGWAPALRSLPTYAQQCSVRLLTPPPRFPVGTLRKGTRRREGTLLCTGDPTMAKKFTLEVTEKQLDLLIGVLREAGGINQTPAFLRRVNVLLDELGRLRMRTSAAPRHAVKART